jgi:hypothetical protein
MRDVRATESLTAEMIRSLAQSADVDPRTIEKRLLGLPVRGKPGVRADREIAKLRGKTARNT